MKTTRLSTKGQVILPIELRVSRDWGPGTEFTVEETGDGILLRPKSPFPESTLDEVAGCLRYTGKARTLAQMDAAITAEVKQRRDSGRY